MSSVDGVGLAGLQGRRRQVGQDNLQAGGEPCLVVVSPPGLVDQCLQFARDVVEPSQAVGFAGAGVPVAIVTELSCTSTCSASAAGVG